MLETTMKTVLNMHPSRLLHMPMQVFNVLEKKNKSRQADSLIPIRRADPSIFSLFLTHTHTLR